MDRELAVVLGMSISYLASLAGMFIAVWSYKKNIKRRDPLLSARRERSVSGPDQETPS